MDTGKLSFLLPSLVLLLFSFGCQKDSDFAGLVPSTIEPTEDIYWNAANNDRTGEPLISLIMGNSFLVPVALEFKTLTRSAVPGSVSRVYGASGAAGFPRALWEDPRMRFSITRDLKSGRIDLFGMLGPNAFFEGYNSKDTSTWDIAAYRNWIDLALAANPRTEFFIGMHHHALDIGTDSPDFEAMPYKRFYRSSQFNFHQPAQLLTQELRKLYPNNKFYCLWYGETSCELKKMQQSGQLEGFAWQGPKETSIHVDDKRGHMGDIQEIINSLIWTYVFYGPDAVPEIDYLGVDCSAIAKKIGNNIIRVNPY